MGEGTHSKTVGIIQNSSQRVAGKSLFGVGSRRNRRGSWGQQVQVTHWRNYAKKKEQRYSNR